MTMETYSDQGTGTNGFAKAAASALIVASILGIPATSNANLYWVATERTSATPSNKIFSSIASEAVPSTARGILAIRRIADLTWDETGKIFGVSRRTVHLWANGRHPSGDQERRLNRILGILSFYQNLGPSLLREKLMASSKPGTLFFDLLCNDEFEAFQETFAGADVARQYGPPPLSLQARGNVSTSPIALLDALQDRPVTTGKALAKKTVRLKRQVG